MSLKINTTATLFETYLGEPAFFEYEQRDLDGNPVDTSSYVLEWSLNDGSDGQPLKPLIGTPGKDASGSTYHQWLVVGKRLARFRDSTSLSFTLSDCLNDDRDVLLRGSFRINPAAQRFYDNNAGPMARYISRIIHYYDPTRTDKQERVEVVTRKFVQAVSVTATQMDFSNANNSQYLGLF